MDPWIFGLFIFNAYLYYDQLAFEIITSDSSHIG